MRRLIDALTPEQAGSFLNWKGGTPVAPAW